MKKILIGAGAAVAAVFASNGMASAAPDVEAIVNSTCSYEQVVSALEVQSPASANELATSPLTQGWLRNLLNSPADQRRQMIDSVQAFPAFQQYATVVNQVAYSCQNY